MRRLLAFTLLLLALAASSPSSAGVSPAGGETLLRIGVVPFYAPEKIHQLYTPFVEHLSRASGVPLALKVYPDHDSLVSAAASGEVALAFLGPVPAARVAGKVPLRPVAVALNAEGRPSYRSIVVTADPALASPRDLAGKPFGYFKGSTAAHLVPLHLLDRAGVPPASLRLVPLSGQDALVEAVLAREVAAAGIKESLFLKFSGSGLRKVTASGPLPNFAFYATRSLPAPAERKLLGALLSYSPRSREADRLLAAAWDDEVKHGFVRPPKGFASSVEEMGKLFEKYGR